MNARPLPPLLSAAPALGLVLLLVAGLAGQSPTPAPSLTLLSKEGRRAIPITLVGNQEFVALDDLAPIFQLTVREDSLGAITVSARGRTIVLTPDQALASVLGRLVSLPAPPARVGRRWLVPVEFITRAIAPASETRLDLRKASRLLVVGDLRVPRIMIRYEPVGTSARLTVDATPQAASTVSHENERLTIKFDADALDIGTVPPFPPQALVQAVRQVDPVTLAVDLGPRFAGFRAATQPSGAETRLVIDLMPVQTEAAPAQAPPPAAVPDLPPAIGQPVPTIRTIAIDPGHGGEDEGVRGSAGTKEKDLTLAFARRLRAAIEGRLGIRVLLTRDDDRRVALDDRTALANNNKADVFLSLHANAALRKATSGAAIFYAAFDPGAENAARAVFGTERLPVFGGGLRDIEMVPWDVAQIRHVDHSARLAKILEQQLHDRVPLGSRPVDRAPLRVLEPANMPAVLVEIGYLSNAAQEQQLAAADFQNAFVQAVFDGVLRFRDYLDEGRRGSPAAAPGGDLR